MGQDITMDRKRLQPIYSIQICRYLMIPIGIWPLDETATLLCRVLSQLAKAIVFFQISFIMVPCVSHILIEEHDLQVQVKQLGPLSFVVMSISKYCTILATMNEIRACLQHIEDDWVSLNTMGDTAETEIMRRSDKLGKFLSLLSAIFTYASVLSYYTVLPYSINKMIASEFRENMLSVNGTGNKNSEPPRILTWPVYTSLMHVDQSPAYEIVCFMQFISGYCIHTIASAACSLMAVFVSHICGQLEIIALELRGPVNGARQVSSDPDKMAKIVQRHLRALNFADKVNTNMATVCFVEFAGCTLNICMLEYYFVSEIVNHNPFGVITYSFIWMSFVFNIFIFCYIGQLLTDQCEKVSEAAYDMDWFTFSGNKARDLMMIIAIANRAPRRITAGKIFFMNLENFGK
ncbi:hypothetical protein QAD02_005167, partial [Eretmocerus hayati]